MWRSSWLFWQLQYKREVSLIYTRTSCVDYLTKYLLCSYVIPCSIVVSMYIPIVIVVYYSWCVYGVEHSCLMVWLLSKT